MSKYSTDIIDENGQKIFNNSIDANYVQIQPAGSNDKTPDIDGFLRLRDGKGNYLNKKLDYQLKSTTELKNNKFTFSKKVIQYQLSCNVPTLTFVVDISKKKTYWYYIRDHIEELNLNKDYGSKTVDLTPFEIKGDSKHLKEIWEKIASPEKPPVKAGTSVSGELETSTLQEDASYEVQSTINYDTLSEYQSELDLARELIKQKKPKAAIDLLEDLKKRVWYKADNLVKFRLLSNLGASKLALEEEVEASKFFIEAYQYNKDDEKALSNLSLAYLLTGDKENAVVYARKTLEKNPSNEQGLSVLLQASNKKERDAFLKTLSGTAKNTPEVYFSLGFVEYKNKDFEQSESYLRKALDSDKDKSLEIISFLAGVLIEKNIPKMRQLDAEGVKEKDNPDIEEAIELYTQAWKQVEQTDLVKAKLSWLINISFAKRILGRINEAIIDAKKAYELNPDNIDATKNYALILWEKKEYDEAYNLLEPFKESKDFLQASYLMALIKRDEKDFDSAILLIKEQLENKDIPEYHREDGLALIVETYLMDGRVDDAENLIKTELEKDPKSIQLLVFKAKLLKNRQDLKGASEQIRLAYSLLTSETPYTDKAMVASQLYGLKLFVQARDLYEEIIDKTVYSELSYRLLYCYYETNNYAKALALSDSLIEKHGDIVDLLKLQIAIYDEQGNLGKVKELHERLLTLNPKDTRAKIQLGFVLLRLGELDQLDKHLDEDFDLSELSLMERYRFAYLLSIRSKSQKFLDTLYETRRKFYDDEDAHKEYIKLFFMRTQITDNLLGITTAGDGVAVYFKTPEGKVEYYVVDDRDDASKALHEIRLDEELAKKLIGKKVGDKISISKSNIVEIVELKNKYVHALHESMGLHQSLFSNAKDLQSFRVGEPKKEGELPEGFDAIEEQITKQYEHTLQVQGLYKDKKITIGAFAHLIGKNLIEVWGGLVADEKLGISCCFGTLEERTQSVSHLIEGVRIVIDPIALLTFKSLEIGNLLIKDYGKFGIAQSTIDLIRELLTQLEPIKDKGYHSLGKQEDQLTFWDYSPEQVQKNIKYLEDLLDWIKENCDILPINKVEDISKKKREELEKLFGIASVDTLLLCRESNTLLLSDDERMRALGKGEYGINGIWTQALLMDALNKQVISEEQYDEFVIKLVGLNYFYTSVTGLNMFFALKKASWKLEEPFKSFLKIIEPPFSDINSALHVSVDFIYYIFTKQTILGDTNEVIFSVLDSLTKGRRTGDVIKALRRSLEQKFHLLPLDLERINVLIDVWSQGKVY